MCYSFTMPLYLETKVGIEQIARLDRVARRLSADERAELALVRETLEEAIGPTVSRACAARILGVSRTALERFIAKGDIDIVLTPRERHEVPLSELIGLYETLMTRREAGGTLAEIVRERRKEADVLDLENLAPRRGSRSSGEYVSLLVHRVSARKLDCEALDSARHRLRRFVREHLIDPRAAAEWEAVLAHTPEEVARVISASSAKAHRLRQNSPLLGLLTTQERRRAVQFVQEHIR